MASSELLPPAPLATACDADGVLGSPAEKRGEGAPRSSTRRLLRGRNSVWEKRGLSHSALDQQHSQRKTSTPRLKANFFFDDCKINPITNNAIDKHVCFPCLFFHRSRLI